MLEARRTSLWRRRYNLSADGQPLAVWDGQVWRAGGTIDISGHRYSVKSSIWATRFQMTDSMGAAVATAERVGRKRWTVETSNRTYHFQRASWWRSEELLVTDGRPVGSIRRTSVWRSDAVADLPGLPLPVQVFVLVVVLTKWEAQAAAAANA